MINQESVLTKVLLQTLVDAHSSKNVAMKVFLKHYAELVEKLTGTPATETLDYLTREMEKENLNFYQKLLTELQEKNEKTA
jgi:hypothetical protein